MAIKNFSKVAKGAGKGAVKGGISTIPIVGGVISGAISGGAGAGGTHKSARHRRKVRVLSLREREELVWMARHLGKTAAAERVAHYRR